MKTRPILFSGAMVRAILDGTKTQTRRVMNPQPGESFHRDLLALYLDGRWSERRPPPFGVPGDRLWVRETWAPHGARQPGPVMYAADGAIGGWLDDGGGGRFWSHHGWVSGYAAPEKEGRWYGKPTRWRPSIHMPRWASRLTLEVSGVRVERLHDISEEDARAEGCAPWPPRGAMVGQQVRPGFDTARDAFRALWEHINGPGSWEANPWLWVVEFRRIP